MKRLLGGSDIKENCQIESCFDLYHCSRVGSREQTVNLLANSPSVVRVHAMVPNDFEKLGTWLEQLGTCFASMLKPGQHGSSPPFERRTQQT